MIDYKIIIERIKEITGKTQKDIALLIFDISDKNLSNKIKRNSVNLDALINWAGNVNVNLNWLFTGKGEMFLKESDIFEEKDEDPETAVLIEKTREVLKSDTDYALSLVANIKSFHKSVKMEHDFHELNSRVSSLEDKLSATEDMVRTRREDQNREEALKRCSLNGLVRIRNDDPPENREEILKQRTM